MENIDLKNKILAVIAYIPFPPLFIIPLLIAKKDSFVEFHGKQGLVVFLAWFALWILGLIPLIAIVAYIGFVALIVAAIVAIVQTCLGKRWKMPLLGGYAEKLRF